MEGWMDGRGMMGDGDLLSLAASLAVARDPRSRPRRRRHPAIVHPIHEHLILISRRNHLLSTGVPSEENWVPRISRITSA
jgi:hypothetical protein